MIWQDRPADRLLRLIAMDHDNVKYLESLITASSGEAGGMKSQGGFEASTDLNSAGAPEAESRHLRSAAPAMRKIGSVLPEDPSTSPPTCRFGAPPRLIRKIEHPDDPEPPSTSPPPS
jgi:hypothetical protein